MDWHDHEGLARRLLPAVLEAGRIEMAYFERGTAVLRKADDSPVTAADQEAEVVLAAAIERAMPGVPIVAEERAAAGHIPAIGASFFLVDPLDGTREFIAGRDEFTVNIGLVTGGRPVFGIVYAPARGALFMTLAEDSAGEISIAPGSPAPDPRAFRPIRTREPDMGHLVAFSSRSHASGEEKVLAPLAISEWRRLGSSLKFCLLARGEGDLYVRLGNTSEWDTAAGHAVLAAAGGGVCTPRGEALTYGHSGRGFIHPGFAAWGRKPLMTLG